MGWNPNHMVRISIINLPNWIQSNLNFQPIRVDPRKIKLYGNHRNSKSMINFEPYELKLILIYNSKSTLTLTLISISKSSQLIQIKYDPNSNYNFNLFKTAETNRANSIRFWNYIPSYSNPKFDWIQSNFGFWYLTIYETIITWDIISTIFDKTKT